MMLLILVMTTASLMTMANCEETEKLFAKGADQFTGKFCTEVAKEHSKQSVVMSAYSLLYPLGQLSMATTGESHDELLRAIGLPDDNAIRALFPLESNRLKTIKGVELKLASKVYVPQGYELNEQFASDSKSIFNSEVQNIDFTKSATAAQEINTWVEDNTNHHVKDLLLSDDLDDLTRTVLVNAIYFKGSWQQKFDKALTVDQDFRSSETKTLKVPTMYQKRNFMYGESKELNAKLLQMTYDGEDASFVCVLPNEMEGLEQLQEQLKDSSVLERAIKGMFYTEVEVFLPKMKIETKTDVKSILQKIGVTKIFDGINSGLTKLLKTDERLYISQAIQKAYIEINEEGSEATAANAFVAINRSSKVKPVKSHVFKADHPFFFALKMLSGPILFTGSFYGV